MKKIFCISLLTLFTLLSHAYAADTKRLDNIVAVVNDDVVTASEFRHALNLVRMQLQDQSRSEKTLRKQVLTQLVNKKIQLQLAKQASIKASEEELDQAIQHIAEQNNMTTEDLYSRLQHDGMSKKEYRDELRDQLILHKLQQQEVIGRLTVNPQEIKNYKQSQSGQDNSEKEYHIEDILIPIADNASESDIAALKAHATQVATQLQQGKALADIAKAYVHTKKALQSEDLGWSKLNDLPSAFSARVASIPKHGYSDPIQTGNGFHILRLVNLRAIGGRKGGLSDEQIQNMLMQRKFEDAVQTWLVKLRAQAFIQYPDQKENQNA